MQQADSGREHRVPGGASLGEGDRLLVDVGSEQVGVFRVAGKLHAYLNRCPHQGGPVCTGLMIGRTEIELAEDGTVVEEGRSDDAVHIVCPWHGWEYDLQTGACWALPDRKLCRVAVETDAADLVLRL